MKKKLLVVIVVMSMLMMFAGTASAAPLAGGTVELVSADAGPGGTVFIFHVTGEFSRSELHGFAHVEGGEDFGLDCRQVDDETVRCTSSVKVQGNVVVTFGGSTFWIDIAPFERSGGQYCYSVWDYWDFTGWDWVDFGPHCQDEPGQDGDILTYTVPDPGGSFPADVEFFNTPPFCAPQEGPAYYYPYCAN